MVREFFTKPSQREHWRLLPSAMAVMKNPLFARAGIEETEQRNVPTRPGSFLGSQNDACPLDGFVRVALISSRLPQVHRSQNTHRSHFVFHIVRVESAAPKSLPS